MTTKRIGLFIGALVLAVTAFAPAPAGMPDAAWLVAGLVVMMAAWWMTEAIPLTAPALLPFILFPLSRAF